MYNVILSCSVLTVFQKKKTPKGDADLYSLPTKQGECQVIRDSPEKGSSINFTLKV